MLEKYYRKPQTIDRIRATWLAEPIERYVTWLYERGYAPCNVFKRVPLLLHFGAYAQSQGAGPGRICPSTCEASLRSGFATVVGTVGLSGRDTA